ncbi:MULTISPECIES: HAD family hydrolase [unclassified Clostridium]|uniref:HAD family hydrolase n=1 Tax=unclassified Clostridium TaxID=2614128 RepID=UPI000297A9CC|nr:MULTISPECIES: HAD family hydrolase [unclassified Clostridium]EKQ51062.1 MAG: HAD-superfamily hydrolase, subfamily IIB [Clostridium sp. Maddingley MBC34-26]
MIKLIATDMDGTLLDENGHLPDGFVDILDRVRAKNIKLVAASGRPYYTLQTNFGPVGRYLSFICENGALVVDNNEIIYKNILAKDIVKDMITELKTVEGNAIVLCAPNCAYTENYSEENLAEIRKYYTTLNIVDDLSKVDDDIIKIAICNLDGTNNIAESKFKDDYYIVASGEIWTDIMNKGVNKGIALKNLMDTDNISKEETMALGDYYNDIEMLEQAEYSFVMENAPDDMRHYGKYIAASNVEHGVLRAILEYAL